MIWKKKNKEQDRDRELLFAVHELATSRSKFKFPKFFLNFFFYTSYLLLIKTEIVDWIKYETR